MWILAKSLRKIKLLWSAPSIRLSLTPHSTALPDSLHSVKPLDPKLTLEKVASMECASLHYTYSLLLQLPFSRIALFIRSAGVQGEASNMHTEKEALDLNLYH